MGPRWDALVDLLLQQDVYTIPYRVFYIRYPIGDLVCLPAERLV